MRTALGPWEPDSAALDARDPAGRVLMALASGVFPNKTGYLPIPSLKDFSSFALPALCVGAFAAYTSSGGHVIFAGTATKLYKYDTSTGWVDYTRIAGGNYAVASGDYWSFCQFGSKVLACQQVDDVQTIDIDTGATAFTALAGTPPKSRYVTVVGDFVVLACQALFPMRVVNSAINDTTGWTVGVSLCDQQDFADGEQITGLAGGEFGWVTQSHAIRRMIFQPGFDQAFRFERVEREHGAVGGYSVIPVGDKIFFLSDDGFYSFSAQGGLTPIGHQRVNQWFRDNTDGARVFSVLAFTDPYAPRVYWAAYSPAATYLNTLLIYDWALDEWSFATQTAQFWCRQVATGATLEGLDSYGSIDSGVPFSLDSRVWQGGQPVISAITTAGHLAFLNGPTPLNATLLTAPMQLTPSARSVVRSIFPIGVFNDAAVTIRAGKREHTKNPVVYTAPLTPSTKSGIARLRSSGRIHEIELNLAQVTGTVWRYAEGIDIEFVQDGLQ